jgi:hypothetical protein
MSELPWQCTISHEKDPEGRAAWYSFSFLLRNAAAVRLDVDPTELDASFRVIARDGRAIGQAFLCDKLENGAGYRRWFGAPTNFTEPMAGVDPSRPQRIAHDWMDRAKPGPLASKPHGLECDTSCNRCLRDFHILLYHEPRGPQAKNGQEKSQITNGAPRPGAGIIKESGALAAGLGTNLAPQPSNPRS